MVTNVRASGIVYVKKEGKNKLVLVKHESSLNGVYYLLPGGGLEREESITECVKREVHEECGLNVDVGDLYFVKDVYSDQDHTLDLMFLCELRGGKLENLDPDKKVKGIVLVGEEELKSINLIPKQIKDKLFKTITKTVFLGKFKYPEKD